MSALRQRKLKFDGKTLRHRDSLDDEELAGGRVSDNEPPIRQLFEGIEWCNNVLITVILLVCVTCQRYLEDDWRARSVFSFDELMRNIQGGVGVDKGCNISPEMI